jgi:hypothetical protein
MLPSLLHTPHARAEAFGVCSSEGSMGRVMPTPAVRMKRRREKRCGSRAVFFLRGMAVTARLAPESDSRLTAREQVSKQLWQ